MAKASIAKFLNETIQSDESLDKAIETQVKILGDQKSASKTELKKQLTSVKDSASALLKGVVKIGDCYSKGKLVRVTVGIKPETIAAAQGGKRLIQGDDGAGSAIVSAPPTKQLSGVDGYNNSGGISKF